VYIQFAVCLEKREGLCELRVAAKARAQPSLLYFGTLSALNLFALAVVKRGFSDFVRV